MRIVIGILIFLIGLISIETEAQKKDSMEKHGWKLAVQAWSFNRFNLAETLEFCDQLGLKYIEMYPGQKIGGGIEGKTHFSMSQETQSKVKALLAKHDVELINYGVITCKTEEEWNQLFEFADQMGIQTINTEPEIKDLELVDALAKKYKINVALHNHANPTRYWKPEIVLKSIEGRSKYIGGGCDNGHWMRSGIQPSYGYNLLQDHIKTLHFKDMSDFDNLKAHTVPFGTGKHDIKQSLTLLKQLKYKGVITIEYEYNWGNPVADIKQSVDYIREIAKDI